MYCKQTLSATQTQTFPFASLGSVLQLNFNSTTADIIRSIPCEIVIDCKFRSFVTKP